MSSSSSGASAPCFLDIWRAIYAANLLASAGVFVPQIADAAPPSATSPTDGTPQPPVSGLRDTALEPPLGEGGRGRSRQGPRGGVRDQTRLFSQKKWVSLPWTAAQIGAHAVRTDDVRR